MPHFPHFVLLLLLQNAVTSPVSVDKPRKRVPGVEDLTHPLLGDAPTLKLLPDPSQVSGGGHWSPSRCQGVGWFRTA